MRKMIRQIMTLATLCWMVAGCADEVIDRNGGKGEGRLLLTGIEVESAVSDVQTKASLAEGVIPTVSDFTITIVCAATGETVKTLPPGVEAGCFLPVGEYRVKAAYGGSGVTPSQTLTNGEDFFVSGGKGKTYNLILAGQNKLGETVTHTWSYSDLVRRTRYIVQCDPDLPAFTLPAQSDGDVWSKFIYITPMTADNMTAHKADMADKVIANVVYEASADNGETWIPSDKTSDGRYVIKGLEPSKNYTIRSRFGGVLSSNTQTVTTESAQVIANGDMEAWSSTKLHSGNGTWDADMYCDYCTNWNTRNEKTTNGAENANSGGVFGSNKGSGYGVRWRWCSGTWSTTDKKDGEKAAEISTLAFYNSNVSGSWKRASVYSYTRDNGTAYVGYLFTGTFDKNSDSYSLGIAHTARPKSISFDYKYAPLPSTDQCIAYAKIYDSNNVEIATTQEFNSMTQDVYKKETLNFTYTQSTTKAAYIGIFFQSGTNTDIGNMRQVEGGYSTSPYNQDRVVGSVLKIDNVTLNYDYE